MYKAEVIESLKKEAATNPMAKAIFEMWCQRKRARNSVTVGALKQRMDGLGYKYPIAVYQNLLQFLAKLGFGKLESGPKGNIRALREVRTTLQSIGQTAIGETVKLETWKQRTKFNQIAAANKQAIEKAWSTPKFDSKVTIATSINGKLVNIDIPKEFTPDDIAKLVSRFRDGRELV